ELLIDAGEPRFVLLRVALLFHIATEEADLFHELCQHDREFVFHQRRDRFEPGSSSGVKWRINADTSIPFIAVSPLEDYTHNQRRQGNSSAYSCDHGVHDSSALWQNLGAVIPIPAAGRQAARAHLRGTRVT